MLKYTRNEWRRCNPVGNCLQVRDYPLWGPLYWKPCLAIKQSKSIFSTRFECSFHIFSTLSECSFYIFSTRFECSFTSKISSFIEPGIGDKDCFIRKSRNYTQNEWRRCKTTLETSVETLETSVKTLKTSVKTPKTSVKTLKTSVKTKLNIRKDPNEKNVQNRFTKSK